MSDGLEEFRQRLRDAIKRKRDMKSFNPQVVLQRLLDAAEIARRQVAIGEFPTGIPHKMGIPHYGEPGYPGSMRVLPRMEEIEPLRIEEEITPERRLPTVEEKRKEIRKRYPFTSWQK